MSTRTPDERIAQLSPAKRALLVQWRAQQAASAEPPAPLARSAAGDPSPLSFAQQRLWFLDQLAPGQSHYNVAAAVRLRGVLDADRLEETLRRVIARHDALRTTFHAVAGEPQQIVHPCIDWSLRRASLDSVPPAEIEREIDRLAVAEATRPFDLAQGPLLRATLIATPDRHEHVLLLTMHHIVCDGWSMAVLRREVADIYSALSVGREPGLEPLPIQYADYARWQREQLAGPHLEELLDHWSRRLRPLPPPLELPLDHPRPSVQTFRGDVRRLRIDAHRTAALRQMAGDERVTLFMVLVSAFQTLLARYARQNDVCIGTPIANRRHVQVEGLIGFFVNTLALRSDLSNNPTICELLDQVRKTTLDAYAHQDLPFERLVDHLQPPRDLSRTPLFQALFVLQNIPLRAREIGGLSATEVRFDHAPHSNFDLTLNVDEQADRLDISLIYNPDLFLGETIERMLASYEMLLAAFLGDREQRVWQVPLVPAHDVQLLRHEYNVAPSTEPSDLRIEALVAEQAGRTPQACAVADDSESLTYEQLDRRANRLARLLQEHQVDVGIPVGLCLPRRVEMIVAQLAVLKAGGCFVPLDPSYPAERLAYMVDDAGLRLVLAWDETAEGLATGRCSLLRLDQLTAEIECQSDEPLATRGAADDVAYIIYTSGSTGTPKGVDVEHRGLVNHAQALGDAMRLGPGDGILQFLSFSFDAALEEIYPALVRGATIHLHPRPTELVGRDLLDWTRARGVNVLHMPPPVWLSVLSELASHGPHLGNHLKTVLVGGDNVSRSDARRWLDLSPAGSRFLAAYGVTEATITTTLCDAACALPASSLDRLPIGRPIQNARVYVLDDFRQPVPVGVAGELYIGGRGIARQYRGREQLTAERFLPDPFDPTGQGRLYRTGDLVRFLADGQLEFLGRLDQQVKISGYRIEPGEIESVLMQHEQVRDAVVVAQSDAAGDQRLVAYASVLDDGATSEQLQSFLAQRLPRHLLPATTVLVDQLPRLPGGKIDRSALPIPNWTKRGDENGYVPPSNEMEGQLASIWAEVLGVSRVGTGDNFFELGGDSIRSIQVIARASARGIRLTPKQLFQHQTIAELAPHAVKMGVVADQEPVVGPAVLSPMQHELFALSPADIHHFNQSVLLEVRADLPYAAIGEAVTQLVNHHDALRRRFWQEPDGTWLQAGLPPVQNVSLERVDLSQVDPAGQGAALEAAAAQAQAGLDLNAGRLLKGVYFDLGPDRRARLLLVIHHLVVDAVSWRILLDDLCLACTQAGASAPVVLPAKTTAFATWAKRLKSWAGSPAAQSELDDWKACLDFPAPRDDHVQGEDLVASTETAQFELDAEQTRLLLQKANEAYRTRPQELLVAALVTALGDSFETPRVAIELEGHGRDELFDDVEVSRTVGWFTSLYPLPFARPTDDPGDTVRQVKERMRTVPHAGLGFGALRWLAPDEIANQLATLARPAVSFNYLGQFDSLLPEAAPFALADGSTGPDRSPRGRRPHTWEILAHVRGGRLHVHWNYSRNRHRPETIQRLLGVFAAALQAVIAHCLTPGVGGATPSDFPAARVDQDDLDRLSALLDDED